MIAIRNRRLLALFSLAGLKLRIYLSPSTTESPDLGFRPIRGQRRKRTISYAKGSSINGVRLAGESFIKVSSETVEAATQIDQLRPDLEIVTASLDTQSPEERDFILSLCQFLSDSTLRNLCKHYGDPMPSLTDIAILDVKHRSVIIRLIDSYNSW